MKIDVLTLFPEVFEFLESWSIVGRAIKKGRINLNRINIRDFSEDKHRRVDDYPFGGGFGMVMKPEPIHKAISEIRKDNTLVIYLSPQGQILNQRLANLFSKEEHIVLLCGHYEGIDNRIIENYVDLEISIGDYVLTGGEIPAMAVIESIIRLLPGVLNNEESYQEESHYGRFLEYPQYTRPRVYEGMSVPEVLLSGNHKKIENWRKYQSIRNTYIKRPDLINSLELSNEEKVILEEIKRKLANDN